MFSRRPVAFFAAGVLAAGAALAQGLPGSEPQPVLSYDAEGRPVSLYPRDIADIEISESGGVTDMFLRMEPAATGEFARVTGRAVGRAMTVRICGFPMLDAVIQAPVTTGTIYIPDTTAVRAEALRALWHGRRTCAELNPEIFPIAQ